MMISRSSELAHTARGLRERDGRRGNGVQLRVVEVIVDRSTDEAKRLVA
jgi:hypothetical protein